MALTMISTAEEGLSTSVPLSCCEHMNVNPRLRFSSHEK